jgi:RimJ/RimL family protein N-acetyltransferase
MRFAQAAKAGLPIDCVYHLTPLCRNRPNCFRPLQHPSWLSAVYVVLVKPALHPVETERLRLLPWDDSYADQFAELCSDPVAMGFISRGDPLPRRVVDEILARTREMWREHGFGPWAALEKPTGRWIGRIGLNLLADWPGTHKWEVGYELVPAAWGKGYATEGARRAIGFAWEETSLERIISVTVPDHLASRRVMEKAGMTLQGEVGWRGTTVVWYAVDRSTLQAEVQ